MKQLLNRTVLSSFLFLMGSTLTVSAQGTAATVKAGFGTFSDLIDSFSQTVVVAFGSLLMAGAVVIFFMGIVQYIWGLRSGSPGKAKTGSNFMLWGLLGLFVMFSVYGIVKLAQGIFFNNQDITTITIPKIKFDNAGGLNSGGGSPLGSGAVCGNSCATNNLSCTCSNGASGTCRNNVCTTQ